MTRVEMMQIARDEIISYTKEHKEPISPAQLVNVLCNRKLNLVGHQKFYDHKNRIIWQEAYRCMITHLLNKGVLKRAHNWKVVHRTGKIV